MKGLKTILLADDDAEDVELTLSALEEYKLANTVVVAKDGAEALDYLMRRGAHAARPEGNPVVVLLDLKMPKVNGIEVIKAVKADPALRTIPIVVLTSSRESRDIEECYRLGVNAFVVKPVKFNEFADAIKELCVFWALLNEPPPGSVHRPPPGGNGK